MTICGVIPLKPEVTSVEVRAKAASSEPALLAPEMRKSKIEHYMRRKFTKVQYHQQ